MTTKEFVNAINFLTKAYGKQFDQSTTEVWYTFFKDSDFKDFMNASMRLIKREKFMPSIADITSELATVHNPDLQLNAEAEWAKVNEAIRKYGLYHPKEAMASLTDYTASVVKRMGGFRNLCMSEQGDWDRKTFIQTFNSMQKADREMLSYSPKQLTGEEMKRLSDIKKEKQLLLGSQ